MIVRDYFRLSHPAAPMAASYGARASCEEWRDRIPHYGVIGRDLCQIDRVPCCACCGDDFSAVRERGGSIVEWPNGAVRCDRHQDRNPCAVEGCRRTRAAPIASNGNPYVADDQSICAEHWRRYVPPRSRERRLYHRHFARAKRLGWDAARERAFWRYWSRLVDLVRRRAGEGFVDERAIAALMGWESVE